MAPTSAASMGPQPSSRGNQTRERRRSVEWRKSGASMGPQPSSRGNASPSATASLQTLSSYASMGPQPSSRGNCPKSRVGEPSRADQLQWGRNLPVAEIAKHTATPTRSERHSMGPQPSSRGNARILWRARRASMGPQPSSRGNQWADDKWTEAVIADRLQWGRNLPVAEIVDITPLSGCHTKLLELQWGRNLPVAEICLSRNIAKRSKASFNGAATFQSRKCLDVVTNRTGVAGFNGAATFQSRKFGRERTLSAQVSGARRLQWGRNLPVAEIRLGEFEVRKRLYSALGFNGAATFQSRKLGSGGPSLPAGRVRASMGPQPSSRGNKYGQLPNRVRYAVPSSFNGAATFQSRKCPECPWHSRLPAPSTLRFNGAATFQSRKSQPVLAS